MATIGDILGGVMDVVGAASPGIRDALAYHEQKKERAEDKEFQQKQFDLLLEQAAMNQEKAKFEKFRTLREITSSAGVSAANEKYVINLKRQKALKKVKDADAREALNAEYDRQIEKVESDLNEQVSGLLSYVDDVEIQGNLLNGARQSMEGMLAGLDAGDIDEEQKKVEEYNRSGYFGNTLEEIEAKVAEDKNKERDLGERMTEANIFETTARGKYYEGEGRGGGVGVSNPFDIDFKGFSGLPQTEYMSLPELIGAFQEYRGMINPEKPSDEVSENPLNDVELQNRVIQMMRERREGGSDFDKYINAEKPSAPMGIDENTPMIEVFPRLLKDIFKRENPGERPAPMFVK